MEDEERLDCVSIFGELDTLLRDRSWSGDWGKEVDLRNVFRRGLSLTSDEDGCLRIDSDAFPELFRDLRVALITSVAKIAFSFGDNSFS